MTTPSAPEIGGAQERRILRTSVLVTVFVGSLGVLFGLLSGSLSIVFDGVFSVVDASMTGLALLVSRLIARQASARFQLGFWHLEPMVLAFNGALLMLLSFYALVNAVSAILAGGRLIEFGWAIVYASFVVVICFGMVVWERRANRGAESQFVALDVKGWIMSGSVTLALLLAFAVAYSLEGTRFEPYAPYADPAILAILTVLILPVPARTVLSALKDILLVAPADLDRAVRAAAEAIVARHGFSDVRTYVAKSGRGRTVEIHFVLPPRYELGTVEWSDRIREEVSAAIGFAGPDRWLTVTFTGDVKWAD